MGGKASATGRHLLCIRLTQGSSPNIAHGSLSTSRGVPFAYTWVQPKTKLGSQRNTVGLRQFALHPADICSVPSITYFVLLSTIMCSLSIGPGVCPEHSWVCKKQKGKKSSWSWDDDSDTHMLLHSEALDLVPGTARSPEHYRY